MIYHEVPRRQLKPSELQSPLHKGNNSIYFFIKLISLSQNCNCRNLCPWSSWHIMLTFSDSHFYDERLEWCWWTKMTYRKTFSEVGKNISFRWLEKFSFTLWVDHEEKKRENRQMKNTNWFSFSLQKSYRN